MKNLIFQKKKINYRLFLFIFLLFIITIFINYFLNINKNYFVIPEYDTSYYVIPKDKEGEKVQYLDKKSLNKKTELLDNININEIDNLDYTIQIFSDSNFFNVLEHKNKLLKNKAEIIFENELYIFYIETEISNEYFLTYKNFNSKFEANEACSKLKIIVKNCLIIKPQPNKL